MSRTGLPEELVWKSDGHLSDVAITALADGEASIVPVEAQEHLRSCGMCLCCVGDAALVSLDLTQTFEQLALPVARFPALAVVMTLVLGFLAAGPTLLGLRQDFSEAWRLFARAAPLVLRSVVNLASSSSVWLPTVSLSASAVLVLVGFFVARWVPRTLSP